MVAALVAEAVAAPPAAERPFRNPERVTYPLPSSLKDPSRSDFTTFSIKALREER